tara:strand:- start:61 stop:360 length:300 start_codon:yes stop_codon:yes gene_type:complete
VYELRTFELFIKILAAKRNTIPYKTLNILLISESNILIFKILLPIKVIRIKRLENIKSSPILILNIGRPTKGLLNNNIKDMPRKNKNPYMFTKFFIIIT